MVGAPAALAAVRDGCGVPVRLRKRLEKSTPPVSKPMGGISTSLTSEETIFPNAPPIMTPIAMSSTLPFMANSLNSFSIVPPHEDLWFTALTTVGTTVSWSYRSCIQGSRGTCCPYPRCLSPDCCYIASSLGSRSRNPRVV